VIVREIWFVVPGDLGTRTGGYGYDREIIAGLRSRGWIVHVETIPGTYPFPTDLDRSDAARALAGIPDGALVIVDGLAFGALPTEASLEHGRLRLIALVHHPLALETGISAIDADRLRASEQRALASARAVIVTSRRTVTAVEQLATPRGLISVVEPGTSPASGAAGTTTGPVELLCVASVVPRKGHDTLLAALEPLGDVDWRLSCVGSVDRDSRWGAEMRDRASQGALAGRVRFIGELEGGALDAAYHRADLFVLATRYEGYGMVVAEALARGLPVVSTPTGAIADLVTPGVGALVPADDPPALSAVLRPLVASRRAIGVLKAGAMAARAALRSWTVALADLEEVLERLDRGHASDARGTAVGTTASTPQP
jgi:glycosyltransferase involved in cell wall biosynthesis